MATENETLDQGSFSIQDTMEYAGSRELLAGLNADDTFSADPEKIKDINSEEPQKPETKEVADETKTTSEKNPLSAFLTDTGEDDEDENDEDLGIKSKASDTKKEVDESSADDDQSSDNKFNALANELLNLGVFTPDGEEDSLTINSPEEFLERFQEEKRKGATEAIDNFLSKFGEDYKNAFQAIFVKGVDPQEYFGTYNTIVNFAELDLTKEENQEKVVRQGLLNQGYDNEDINAEIERLKSYADLEDVATRHHKVLIKKEAKKLESLETEAAQKEQLRIQNKQTYVQNVQSVLQNKLKDKEFDGIPLNPKLANEVQDFLITDKWKLDSGETLTDFDRAILELKRPENHEKKVKLALLLKLIEKDPNLSSIQRSGASKKNSQLFQSVTSFNEKAGSKTNNKNTSSAGSSTSWFGDIK